MTNASPTPFSLTVLQTKGAIRIERKCGATLTIGSASTCDVVLADPDVAAHHATIKWNDGRYVLVREENPLLVNGLRTRVHSLAPHDLIVIGKNALAFQAETTNPSPRLTEPLDRLRTFMLAILGGDTAEALSKRLLEDALALTSAQRGTLVGFEQDGQPYCLFSCAVDVADDEALYSRTLIERCRTTLQAVVVYPHEAHSTAGAPSLAGIGARAAIPITDGTRLWGVLYLAAKTERALDSGAIELMSLYATQAVSFLRAEKRAEGLEAKLCDLGQSEDDTSSLIGASPPILALRKSVRRLAPSDVSILIRGETGTGKELVARELHRQSPRSEGPFVAVNCGAIASELFASELFGHVKGAFTQAARNRQGYIMAADGGTLFFDEIGDMPIPQQVALLRVLQERIVVPVGAETGAPVNVRILAASNLDFEEGVRTGRFRQDLYFRLAGVTLELPPLRSRGGDVLLLAHRFLDAATRAEKKVGLSFSEGALSAMTRAAWAGNVRQLEAVVHRAVLLAEDKVITQVDLGLDDGHAPDGPVVQPLIVARDVYLKRYVQDAVARFDGNRTAAADALLVSVRTVFKYLEEV